MRSANGALSAQTLHRETCTACQFTSVCKACPPKLVLPLPLTTTHSSKDVPELIQGYITQHKKLIFHFSRSRNELKDGSFPRTFPDESVDQLANKHQSASDTLLSIQKSCRSGTKRSSAVASYEKIRNYKPRSAAARKEDHSIVAFKIKAAEPQKCMFSKSQPLQVCLNRDFCLKSSTVCTQCGSTQTPEWRSGPSGSRTLCNA